MVGDALVGLRVGTTALLHGETSSTQELHYFWHAKCQNVKLPMISALRRLDKFVSGIPNAIRTTSQRPEPSPSGRGTRICHHHDGACAAKAGMLMPAYAAC